MLLLFTIKDGNKLEGGTISCN